MRATALQHRPIVILGDASLAPLAEIRGVELVDVTDWRRDPGIERLRRAYVHRSSNGVEFEWFCFERVLLLRRFLAARNLERCFHLDSDCILLQPLSRFPLHLHKVWLVNNDFYHLHGFSPLPSASIHAALLDAAFVRANCHRVAPPPSSGPRACARPMCACVPRVRACGVRGSCAAVRKV